MSSEANLSKEDLNKIFSNNARIIAENNALKSGIKEVLGKIEYIAMLNDELRGSGRIQGAADSAVTQIKALIGTN